MGKSRDIIHEMITDALNDARKMVNTNPTDKQIKAGNYRMGHISIQGLDISIENPRGSYRKGKDKSGKAWKKLMHNDYGYFTRTVGKDGDAIDVFLGPNLSSKKVFPVDQFINNNFDETKVMLGFNTKEEAKAAYLSNYGKDWKGFKYITEVDMDIFKKWLYDGYRQRKPFAKYVKLTENMNTDKLIKKMISEALDEKFKSQRLAQLAKDNEGLKTNYSNGKRDGNAAYKHGNYIPASELTDDMIGDTFKPDDYTDERINNSVGFNNGTFVSLKNHDNIPYRRSKYFYQKTDKNYGRDGIEDRTVFPGGHRINNFSDVPCYTKVNGEYYQNVRMKGAPDTGRHDKKVEPQQTYTSTPHHINENIIRTIVRETIKEIVGAESENVPQKAQKKNDEPRAVFDRRSQRWVPAEHLWNLTYGPESDLNENLEDEPEFRPQGKKYFKYSVHGHTFKRPRSIYDKKTGRYFTQGPIIDYPSEEFENDNNDVDAIEDARACADRFRKMPNSIPDNVRIKGHFHTLGDDDWEYIL